MSDANDTAALGPFFKSTKETIDHVDEMLSTGRVKLAHEALQRYRERWKDALWGGKSRPPSS